MKVMFESKSTSILKTKVAFFTYFSFYTITSSTKNKTKLFSSFSPLHLLPPELHERLYNTKLQRGAESTSTKQIKAM